MGEFVFLFEMLGTIAFAISGTMIGLRKQMDLLGVIVSAVLTATGGGVIRDIILGSFPPVSFRNPIYVFTAFVVAVIIFIYFYLPNQKVDVLFSKPYKKLLLVMDSIGLGIFTVTGVSAAMQLYPNANGFLWVFSGVVTGVGGGLLRDVITNRVPDIFTKHIYAVASMVGGMVASYLFHFNQIRTGIILGTSIVIVIRLCASRYGWNLPKITSLRDDES